MLAVPTFTLSEKLSGHASTTKSKNKFPNSAVICLIRHVKTFALSGSIVPYWQMCHPLGKLNSDKQHGMRVINVIDEKQVSTVLFFTSFLLEGEASANGAACWLRGAEVGNGHGTAALMGRSSFNPAHVTSGSYGSMVALMRGQRHPEKISNILFLYLPMG